MFVGHSALRAFVEQCVRFAPPPPLFPRGDRPVLVVTGTGGPGRSELLRELSRTWAPRTPTVLIGPHLGPSDSLRPVLVAVMDGLSDAVRGYEIEFPRVVLAYVAVREPVEEGIGPDRARAIIRERMNVYRDRAKLVDLLGEVVGSVGSLLQAAQFPGFQDTGTAAVEAVAERVVDSVRRSGVLARFSWKDALAWFGHQDLGLTMRPEAALVRLSRQAAVDDVQVRREVDELLVGALLADLRSSLAGARNRPWNPLLLLDGADSGSARSFLTALVAVRSARPADSALVDPLVVLATSGGAVTTRLPGVARQPRPDSGIDRLTEAEVRASPWWLWVQLGDLGPDDVLTLARTCEWPADVGVGRVAAAVHRAARGYPAATVALIRALAEDPTGLDDIDRLLRKSRGGTSIQDDLLALIAGGLTEHGVDADLRQTLALAAAGRDRDEAELLLGQIPTRATPAVIASPTLWSATGPRGRPALPPFIRDVGLRLLAWGPDRQTGWKTAYTTLADRVDKAEDHAGWLHHNLVLGRRPVVVDELTEALPPAGDDSAWLDLLDQTTATPVLTNPDQRFRPRGEPRRDAVDRLVATLGALGDPRLNDPAALRGHYLLLENDLRQLAGASVVFLLRAQHYARLADQLA